MSGCGVRIELECALELGIRSGEVPVEDSFCFAQIAMRLGIFLVERDCLQSCFFRGWIRIQRLYVNVGQEIPDLRDSSPSARKCWILLHRALEEIECST